MIRLLLLLAWLSHHVYSVKDCNGIPFCSQMRHQDVGENSQYSADIENYYVDDNVATIPLRNGDGKELNLQITILTGGKARVKVLENDHNRYEITDVLTKEFPAVDIKTTDSEEGSIVFVPDYDENIIVRVRGSAPFSVEFLYNGQVEVVLKGNRLVMNSDDDNKAFSFDIEFEGSQTLYGLFHHTSKLALPETADGSSDPFRFRNSDAPAVPVGSTQAMYGTVPVIYGHSAESTSGIFLHNAAEEWVDISYSGDNPSAYFMVESGTLDLFVLFGPTPKEVIRQFTDLTGTAHLPQLWALGYHQCRFSYLNQEDVKDVVANMDNNNFPMDVIWLDIDYTDQKKYFTWNPETFSDPEEMQQNLSSTNRKLVTIIDPHYKVDQDYPVYTGAANEGLFLKWADGTNFEGNCWPGTSSWFDFLNPAARDYYASWFAYDKFKGSTEVLSGIWNDMNEPAVFNGDDYENTAPFELLHIGDVPHRDVHNMYGFLQTMATHQGLMQRDNGQKRPFVLTRSHFAGSQRYTAMWTGDCVADWPVLGLTYSECINANLVGMVFCGADVGGFMGNPGDELMQRWYQAAIWLPFFRQHSNSDTNRREPYLFSEDVQNSIRNAMRLRYKHIPVWYTLFYEHTRYGDPLIRPFFYDYPELEARDDHVLLGSDILARPVVEQGQSSVTVVFPGSGTTWYRVDDDSWSTHKGDSSEEVEVDINTSPYYYRAGSIIPRKEKEVRSTEELKDVALTLFVNLDESGNAVGNYYQDDYESFKYSTDNLYLYLNFTYIPDTKGVRITIIDGDSEGVTPVLQGIITHSFTEESEMVYTTNSEGVPLRDLDIAGHFARTRSNEMIIFL